MQSCSYFIPTKGQNCIVSLSSGIWNRSDPFFQKPSVFFSGSNYRVITSLTAKSQGTTCQLEQVLLELCRVKPLSLTLRPCLMAYIFLPSSQRLPLQLLCWKEARSHTPTYMNLSYCLTIWKLMQLCYFYRGRSVRAYMLSPEAALVLRVMDRPVRSTSQLLGLWVLENVKQLLLIIQSQKCDRRLDGFLIGLFYLDQP